jgi:preprotein translocase subunit SecG
MSVLIVLFTTILLILSAFVVLVILMQKPSANAGMGSALGGGAAEQAFGGDAANVLTRTTVFSIIGFFILAFGLYLANLAVSNVSDRSNDSSDLQSLVSGFEEEKETEAVDQPVAAPVIDEKTAIPLDSILEGESATTPEATEETPVVSEEEPVSVPAE